MAMTRKSSNAEVLRHGKVKGLLVLIIAVARARAHPRSVNEETAVGMKSRNVTTNRVLGFSISDQCQVTALT